MFTIVGLGNPGDEYKDTHHNAGRDIVEALAKKYDIGFAFDKKANAQVGKGDIDDESVRLILPDTFMNKSGGAVSYFIKNPKQAKTLVVVHDDLDLPLGMLRFVFARGSGGHKGVESVKRAIKTEEFIRLRVGISKESRGRAKKPSGEDAVIDFVLKKWSKAETEEFKKVKKEAIKALDLLTAEGLQKATMETNTRKG